eukprot:m.150939 g.150939  ORF g.150939 m.150939 type:complete len:175 (+) comp16188_c0_seq1:595-1119(+)
MIVGVSFSSSHWLSQLPHFFFPCFHVVCWDPLGKFLKGFIAQLQRAKEALVFDRYQVPDEYFRQVRSFTPPLPQDTTLEFHLKNGRLLARCLRISPWPGNPTAEQVRRAKQPFLMGGSLKGYVFMHQQLWMVVEAEEIGTCEVPIFSTVLGLLHDAQHLVQALSNQMSVFQSTL